MKNVFLKPGYQKVTKLQSGLDVAAELAGVDFLETKVGEEVTEFEYVPFELFTVGLNPLTDYCRANYKNVKQFVLEDGDFLSVDPVTGVHYVIIVKENAKASLVIEGDQSCLASVEIYVKKMAELKVVLLQTNNTDFNFSAIRAKVEANAKIECFLNYFAISKAYSFVQNWLVGENAVSNIYLVSSSVDTEFSDFFAGNCFDARNCQGQILAKAVSQDKSKMSFVGEIEITLQGGGTDSYLKEDVLMLDATSKIDAVPSLEIKTNDVKAGHGVSISRLTDDKLFYLTSRGISKADACKLLVDGFLREIFNKTEMPEMIARLEAIIV